MGYGASQYTRSQGSALSPRETEAAAFSLVNRLLGQAADPHQRIKGLAKNQQLWSMLLRDVGCSGNALPPVLKSDLTRLGLFSIRQSIAAMGDVRSVAALVEINEQMIAALRSGADGVGRPEAARDPSPAASHTRLNLVAG